MRKGKQNKLYTSQKDTGIKLFVDKNQQITIKLHIFDIIILWFERYTVPLQRKSKQNKFKMALASTYTTNILQQNQNNQNQNQNQVLQCLLCASTSRMDM